jgi:microcompartment protein CcmL/EutN
MKESALGLIELKSIPRGMFVTDVIAKKAPVKILTANPICPGKYMIIFAGEVADVEASFQVGVAASGDFIVNELFLPYIHRDVIPALTGTTGIETFISLGILETFSVASCVKAADIAAKMSNVKLVEIRLANGLGGKAFFVMTGELADVEASIEASKQHVQKEGLLAGAEIIASPHPDMIEKSVYW